MKKLLLGLGVAVLLIGTGFGINKAMEKYEYSVRLEKLEQDIDCTYGEDCQPDYDNLLISDEGIVTNVLDSEGNHVAPYIGWFVN